MSKERDIKLDLIRCLAIIFVISVHSLSNSGFYNQSINGVPMFLSEVLRCLFITCVPLFLLLTGYLNNNSQPSKRYYSKLLNVVIVYIICGMVCQLALVAIDHVSIKQVIISFFDFSACPYAWYIEMYIGLYLLIPFLNILWSHCSDKEKESLLICLLIIVTMPSLVSNYNFDNFKFWQSCLDKYTKLAPEFFINLYPFLYFFLGKFIREKKAILVSKIKRIYLVVTIFVGGGINFLKNYNAIFPWNHDTSYYSYQAIVVSIIVFVLCLNSNLNKRVVNGIISIIAKYSLGIYLLSYLIDRIWYYHILEKFTNSYSNKFLFLPLSIIFVTVCSLIISIPITKISNIVFKKVYGLIVRK